MPSVVIEIGVPPEGVTVTPVGAVVVELPAASVVVTPPLDTTVELPAASEIVEEAPVTICVLPFPSVNVADVKPVKAFASLRFNVPFVSPITAILPDVRSVALVEAPPLIVSFSPCLRLTTVASSPPNSWVASAVALVMASSICFLLTAASSVVALPTFLISVLPASIPEPFNLTVLVPSVAVIPVGATVVVFVPSVVDRPPFVRPVV